MKLFFTIFGAILAAAAVIWAVSSYSASKREADVRAAKIVEGIETMTKITRLTSESLQVSADFDDSDLRMLKVNFTSIEGMLHYYPERRLRIRELSKDFIYENRELAKRIREIVPAKKDGADELEILATKLETMLQGS